ncbi:hypothetical protein DDT46_02740 [Mycobacteroides abscessus]|uniref:Uncharacterized protein n=1 Tax=Mycobacteroides abscessus TaxID=36809 RepID=A0ABD7HHT8_9MYCO|nr:hypothetical protein DDT46_02740 [Mycobacteroides abscessus]PVA73720.1 hypothetical protein DDJ37_15025 [Mycobacteroides abscessus]PVB11940.1 hypothetical protein DDJ40_16360 [Mycobacteroides abscessus]PVB16633.1 hypothetical protein DDJ71_20995 [Mycobacteroides abscessus]RIR41882.1 hypothetical protein D2E39_20415 [Mycobacteroides abscessus]
MTNRPLALVTGATSGIGYELAKQFATFGQSSPSSPLLHVGAVPRSHRRRQRSGRKKLLTIPDNANFGELQKSSGTVRGKYNRSSIPEPLSHQK